MNYYHGSYHKFEEEYISPKNEYTSAESVKKIEELFESVRPKHCIPRIDCVFLVKNEEDIDPAGGYTDYIYLVEAEDVDKSDLAWYSKASSQLEEGDVEGAIESAHKYWAGDVFEILNHSLFEYRTPFAVIIECIEEE